MHEGLYIATATTAPVLYLAFRLEIQLTVRELYLTRTWYMAVVNAIYFGAAFITIEFVSLLVLSGLIRDAEWSRLVVVWLTGTFGFILVLSSAGLLIWTGIDERRAARRTDGPRSSSTSR